jgi:hypothetical protein
LLNAIPNQSMKDVIAMITNIFCMLFILAGYLFLLISRNLSQISNNKTICTIPIISMIAIINSYYFKKFKQ